MDPACSPRTVSPWGRQPSLLESIRKVPLSYSLGSPGPLLKADRQSSRQRHETNRDAFRTEDHELSIAKIQSLNPQSQRCSQPQRCTVYEAHRQAVALPHWLQEARCAPPFRAAGSHDAIPHVVMGAGNFSTYCGESRNACAGSEAQGHAGDGCKGCFLSPGRGLIQRMRRITPSEWLGPGSKSLK